MNGMLPRQQGRLRLCLVRVQDVSVAIAASAIERFVEDSPSAPPPDIDLPALLQLSAGESHTRRRAVCHTRDGVVEVSLGSKLNLTTAPASCLRPLPALLAGITQTMGFTALLQDAGRFTFLLDVSCAPRAGARRSEREPSRPTSERTTGEELEQ